MERTTKLLRAAGVGAALMYFLDPQLGRRRRAVARDSAIGAGRRAGEWLDKAVRDAQHRVEGTIAEFEALFDSTAPSAEKLVERVRARLGHVASHPHLIDVRTDDGRVTVAGHAPMNEIRGIVSAIYAVRGVRAVDNQLDAQMPPEVHGAARRRAAAAWPAELVDYAWAPSTRLFAGLTGGLLMLNCMTKRTPGAMLLGTLGFGMFLKAAQSPGARPAERRTTEPHRADARQSENEEFRTGALQG
jgi:hypothetical protein